MLLLNLAVDVSHLIEVQFTGQHHHIGKLCIKPQGFDVRYVQLGRKMHLHAFLTAIGHHRNIAGYHSGDLSLHSSIHNLVH